MKPIKLTIACTACFLFFFAGVVREDVGLEKYAALARQKQFNCVGQVFNAAGSQGSAVLISKRHVLSAAHIFMNYITRTDTVLLGGQKTAVNLPVGAKPVDIKTYLISFDDKVYRCKSITVHPDYNWQKREYDLVVIELEKEVTGVAPAMMNTALDEPGSVITGIGFGASGYANDMESVIRANRKLGGQNVTDSIGGAPLDGNGTLLFCDFDHHTNPALNRIGSAVPQPMEYIGAGGDSGGGMFLYRNKKWMLAGIYHSTEFDRMRMEKNGYYGLLMSWSRVSVFHCWIQETISSRLCKVFFKI